jgi:hypothetical protein
VIHNRTFFFGAYEGTRSVAAPIRECADRHAVKRRFQPPGTATTCRSSTGNYSANPAGSGFYAIRFQVTSFRSRIAAFGKGIQEIYPLPQFDVATGNNPSPFEQSR